MTPAPGLLRRSAAAVVLCTLLLRPDVLPADPSYTIKLAALAPEGTHWSDVGRSLAQYVFEHTGGRARVVWFFGGVMGDETDAVRKIRMGQIQGGGFTLVGLGKIAPEIKVLELPFLFRSYGEVDHLLTAMAPEFSRIFREKGFVFAGWLEVGFIRLFSRTPLRVREDLARVKMWTWSEDALAEATLRAMGIRTVVPLNITDVLTSLQTGLVDAFYGPSYATLALQWHDHARYVSDFSFAYTPAAIVFDGKFFRGLPRDIRTVLGDACDRFLPQLVILIRKDEQDSLDSLQSAGLSVVPMDAASLADIQTRTAPLYTEFAGSLYPRSLLRTVTTTLEEFRGKGHRSHTGEPLRRAHQ